MNRWIIVACLFVLLAGCQQEEEVAIPQDILQPDEMAMILTDIQLVEGAKMKKLIEADSNYTLQEKALLEYTMLFDRNGTTQKEFDTSFAFYRNNPEVLLEIYETVLEELSTRRAQINANPTSYPGRPKPPSEQIPQQADTTKQ